MKTRKKSVSLKARISTAVSKANRFIHSDTFSTLAEAAKDGLDIMYKLAAIKSPLALFPVAANIVGVVRKLTPSNLSYLASILDSFELKAAPSYSQITFDLYVSQLKKLSSKKFDHLFSNTSITMYKHKTLPLVMYHSPVSRNAKSAEVISIIVMVVVPTSLDTTMWDVKKYTERMKEDNEHLVNFHHDMAMGQFSTPAPFVKIPENIGYIMEDTKLLPLLREINRTRKMLNESVAFTFYGPPGTGKTSCALNLGQITSSPVIMFDSSSRTTVRSFVDTVSLFKHPIVLFDEVEPDSPSIISILTSLADKKDITYIFTTNTPSHLGARLGRPGRCGKMISFPAPSREEFVSILKEKGITEVNSNFLVKELFDLELTHDYIQKVAQQVNLGFSLDEVVESIKMQKTIISSGPTLEEFSKIRLTNRGNSVLAEPGLK